MKDQIPQSERRTVQMTEIRAAENGQITGYAAVFNQPSEVLYGSFREIIKPGAFLSSLKNDIRALWNHDTAYVLGRNTAGTLTLAEDSRGLRVDITPPETQWARDLMVSIKRGDISQMSFGFRVNKDSWSATQEDGTQVRTLEDVNLHEVSVVTFPAYPQTAVSVRKMEYNIEDAAEIVAQADMDKLSAETLTNLKRSFDRLENKLKAEQAKTKSDLDLKRRTLENSLI